MEGCDCSLNWFCSPVGVFSICVCSNATDGCGIRRDCMCQNNGTCLTQTFDSRCSCGGLYTGMFCDTEIEFTTTEIIKTDLTSVPGTVAFTESSDTTSDGGVNVSDNSTLTVPVTRSTSRSSTTSSSLPAPYVANIPLIIGALGGVIALMLLIMLLFVCFKKHRKRKENKAFDFSPRAIRKRSTIPIGNGVHLPLKYVNQDSPNVSGDKRIDGIRLEPESGEAISESSVEQPSKPTDTNGGYMPMSHPESNHDKEPHETTPRGNVAMASPKSAQEENIQDFSDHDVSTITTPNVDENDITIEISADDLGVNAEEVEKQMDTIGIIENVDTDNLSEKKDDEAINPSKSTEENLPVMNLQDNENIEHSASPKDTTIENIEKENAPMDTKQQETMGDSTNEPKCREPTVVCRPSDNVTRIMLT